MPGVYVQNGAKVEESFYVFDQILQAPVIGLTDVDFTKTLYDSSGSEVSGSISGGVVVSELGIGLYRVTFTPDSSGFWTLNVSNATYFPFGKSFDYESVDSHFLGIGTKDGGIYDRNMYSLQAIRERGDAEWTGQGTVLENKVGISYNHNTEKINIEIWAEEHGQVVTSTAPALEIRDDTDSLFQAFNPGDFTTTSGGTFIANRSSVVVLEKVLYSLKITLTVPSFGPVTTIKSFVFERV